MEVDSADFIAHIRLLEPGEYLLGVCLEVFRHLIPRVYEDSRTQAVSLNAQSVLDVGNAAVDRLYRELVYALAIAQRVDAVCDTRRVRRLFDVRHVLSVSDFALERLGRHGEGERPRVDGRIPRPKVFTVEALRHGEKRREERRVFPIIFKIAFEIAVAELPVLPGLPGENVIENVGGLYAGAAALMILKENVGEERSEDVFAIIIASRAVAPLHILPDDAEKVDTLVSVENLDEVQRRTIGVFRVVRRERKGRRP